MADGGGIAARSHRPHVQFALITQRGRSQEETRGAFPECAPTGQPCNLASVMGGEFWGYFAAAVRKSPQREQCLVLKIRTPCRSLEEDLDLCTSGVGHVPSTALPPGNDRVGGVQKKIRERRQLLGIFGALWLDEGSALCRHLPSIPSHPTSAETQLQPPNARCQEIVRMAPSRMSGSPDQRS